MYGPGAYDYTKGMIEAKNPTRAVSTPADVANSIVWLLDSSTQITGQAIMCDGGFGLNRGGTTP